MFKHLLLFYSLYPNPSLSPKFLLIENTVLFVRPFHETPC